MTGDSSVTGDRADAPSHTTRDRFVTGDRADAPSHTTRDRFVTPSRTIGEEDIMSFAKLTGDMHPQHTDAEWAAGSRFGERIAHGLLVQSCAVGLVDFDPDRVLALRRVGDAVFKLPVRIGDSVHVEGQTLGTRELDDETELVEYRWRVVNQDGRMVLRMNVEVVCRRDAVPAS